jgi:adenosylhomocysteinase
VKNKGKPIPACTCFRRKVDQEIAGLKLKTLGIAIKTLTAEQIEYMTSWETGT